MDQTLAAVLDEVHRHGVEHDATKPDRLDRLRNVEPDTAQLLSVLVRATRATRVLELGTSNGYSTLWLADAVRATGGTVISVEIDPQRSSEARSNLARAGLAAQVELQVADAAEVLAASEDERWDFIFLDAERPQYVEYWNDLRRTLKLGGLLVVDNVISHADQVSALRELIARGPGFTEAIVPTGAGALLVVRDPRGQ